MAQSGAYPSMGLCKSTSWDVLLHTVRKIINCHTDAWKYFEKTNSLYRYCVIYFNLLSIGMHALEYCRMYDRCKSTSWEVLDSALWARSAQIVRALWNNWCARFKAGIKTFRSRGPAPSGDVGKIFAYFRHTLACTIFPYITGTCKSTSTDVLIP